MVIRFSPEARQWLQGRHAAVTVRVSTRHGCCGGAAGVPVVEPGLPEKPSAYRQLGVDGITVYLAPELESNDAYTIRVEGFLGLKRLFVDGATLSSGKE
ncbi:MAG: hypothetical protein JJU06_04455 [Ectothiorhodospiraceae bacterium]|nr:hypothetical protein [Ectothiorhodospiraceae bacterium]MCH8503351.1 hypothetical protein [Ectothiorhodospiraceae bacterium]